MSNDKKVLIQVVSFDDDQIYCILLDSQRYVVVKSITDALGLDDKAAKKNIRKDDILKDVYVIETLQLPNDLENRGSTGFIQTLQLPQKGELFTPAGSKTMISQSRPTMLLPIEYIQGWLFSISSNKVKEAIRPKLIAYKQRCYQVLHSAFNGNMHRIIKNRAFLDKIEQRLKINANERRQLERWRSQIHLMNQHEFDGILDYQKHMGEIVFEDINKKEFDRWLKEFKPQKE